MEPVYLDFHIHTSDSPEDLNPSYDVLMLRSKIEEVSQGTPFLISISDHNVINKAAYMRAKNVFENLLVGVELHVRNYDEVKPYHCHILFDLDDITEEILDDPNESLNVLYPEKIITAPFDKVPTLQEIMNEFDQYEFILLPHGGQNHSTFDRSIPDGVQFDRTLERSIYYNHFDGFTADLAPVFAASLR